MIERVMYFANDGQMFDNPYDCELYERNLEIYQIVANKIHLFKKDFTKTNFSAATIRDIIEKNINVVWDMAIYVTIDPIFKNESKNVSDCMMELLELLGIITNDIDLNNGATFIFDDDEYEWINIDNTIKNLEEKLSEYMKIKKKLIK